MTLNSAGFEDLPDEILGNILYQLPHGDVLSSATRVCKKWLSIISADNFMKYKNLYYAYKKGHGPKFDQAQIWLENEARSKECFMDGAYVCFLGFVKKMRNFPLIPLNPDGTASLIKRELQKMDSYPAVVSLFEEQSALKDCMDPSSKVPEPNPLCVLAVMLVITTDVESTTSLLRGLLKAVDDLSKVMEMFYAAATFFLFFHRRLKIPDIHHYVVFAAIHSFEGQMQVNQATLDCLFDKYQLTDDQRSQLLKSQRFSRITHEQFKIVSYDIGGNDVIKINAFAGTGKTTTLISYTEVRPNTRFLYIAYNKSIQLDAEKRFPRNVTCKTMHSIAYAATAKPFAKAKKIRSPSNGAVFSSLQHMAGFNTFSRATYALRTVNNYIASTDRFMVLDHVPTLAKGEPITPEQRQQYLADALDLWEKMQDLRNKYIGMSHDGYLKLFQLKESVDFATTISKAPFDVILVDEAQDMSPANIDLLLRQNAPRILVGDPNQQIYGFRGAVNAMSLIDCSTVFYLTQSFRFGPQIAHLCDTLLSGLKGLKSQTVIGNDYNCTTNGDVIGQLCVITRSNYHQFAEAVKAIEKAGHWQGGGDESLRPRIAFAGNDKKGSFFDQLMDVFHLFNNEKDQIDNNYIKKFSSFQDLFRHSDKVEDKEILGKCQIVNRFKKDVGRHVDEIRMHMTDDQDQADILFTTAHKSKGLEFDTVKVVDDFYVTTELERCSDDEKNLLYVAVSRAKKSLIMNETVIELLRHLGESFVSLQHNSDKASAPLDPSKISGPAQRCVVRRPVNPNTPTITVPCDKPAIFENSWILNRPAVSINLPYEIKSSSNSVERGSFCRQHGFMAMPAYIPFLKTPSNLPEPKAKLSFSSNGLAGEQAGAGEGEGDHNQNNSQNSVNEDVEYDSIALNHFNPAFRRQIGLG